MTFSAHKLVLSEPFLYYLYEFWQLLSALYSKMRKILYRCISTFLAETYSSGILLENSQLSIRSGAHKLLCRFFYFSKFSPAISRELWRHLATKTRTV